MKRRDFITLLGGAAVAWPRVARAQQGERVRRIGVLLNTGEDDTQRQARLAAFVHRLMELGWTDGRNVRIDTRWAAGDVDRLRRYTTELVALAPDVVFTETSIGVATLQQATRVLPIVFAGVIDQSAAASLESWRR